ncbi:MAG: hypothetical protein GY730_10095 [bacterium]|nr:hypothetical protein [bacterium]
MIKYFYILILLFSCTALSAESIEDTISTPGSSSDNNNHHHQYHHYNSHGGYHTDTEVIDSEYLYVATAVRIHELNNWLALFYKTMAIEAFVNYEKQGLISNQGEVITKRLVLKDKVFHKGQLLLISDLIYFMQKNYSAGYIWDKLVNNDVLSKQGFIKDIKNESQTKFSKVDFSGTLNKVLAISLPVKNKTLSKNLKKDLYRLLIYTQKINELTKLKSTDYRSSSPDFFKQITDSFLGNIVGSIFMPDQTIVSSQRVAWTRSIDPYNYFVNFRNGFNYAPYHRHGKGLEVLNGKTELKVFDINFCSSGKKHAAAAKFDLLNTRNDNHPDTSINFTRFSLECEKFEDSDSRPLFLAPSIGAGIVSSHILFDVSFGLTFKDGKKTANAIGYSIGTNFSFYPIQPVSLDFSWTRHEQPDFNKQLSLWQYNKTSLGLSFYTGNFQIQSGYKWYISSDSVFLENYFFGIKTYF